MTITTTMATQPFTDDNNNQTDDEENDDSIMEDFNQNRRVAETPPPQQRHFDFEEGEEEEESFNSTNDSIDEEEVPLIVPPSSTGNLRHGRRKSGPGGSNKGQITPKTNNNEMVTSEGPQRRRTAAAVSPAAAPAGGGFEEPQFYASTFQPPSQQNDDDERKKKEQTWRKRIQQSISNSYYRARNSVRKKTVAFRQGYYTPVPKEKVPDETASSVVSQPLTEDDYYEDEYNDYSWSCTFGTGEDDGIWMNTSDQAGTIMACLVWIFIIYSGVTVTLLAKNNHFPYSLAMVYCTTCGLALASHAKTTFTDPGAVPSSAVPSQSCISLGIRCHAMCSQCQTFKPPFSHHCRICGRCISRMDHHCPWMNNCIGAANFKHFILFLVYIWIGSAMALSIFGWNYFLCGDETCTFNPVLIQLVRSMTLMCFGSLLFTSSMIMNVTYGIMTGIGTIDRLKRKAMGTMMQAEDEAIPLKDIFGIRGYWTWWIPIDPVFEDYDFVMGYSTPQRLLREQTLSSAGTSNATNGSQV